MTNSAGLELSARIGQFELYNGAGGGGSTSFTEEQNILKGDIDTTMSLGGAPVTMRTWTGANDNLVVTRIQANAATRILFQDTPEEVVVGDGSVPEVRESIHTRKINTTE